MRLRHCWIWGLAAALVLAAVTATSVGATTQDFYFKDFTADYYLTKAEDGTSRMHVKEVLTAVFPETNQNHGITRAIPYLNQGGKNRTVDSAQALNLAVTRNGQAENIAQIAEGPDEYIIYVGEADKYVHGEQTYTLEYDFANVITEFDANSNNVSGQNAATAFQELYWDTNGTGWSQKFDKVTARLHVPTEIATRMGDETWCYVGKYGDKGVERCKITATQDGFSFVAENLAAGENLTFVTEFEPETFKVVRRVSYAWVIALVVEMLAIAGLMAWKVWRWRTKASEQYKLYKATFVAPQYQAPEDDLIHVAEAEQICLKETKPSYVATLLELAVMKAVTIKRAGEQKKDEWSVKIEVDPETLSESQMAMLRILKGRHGLKQGDEIAIEKHTATRALADYATAYKKDAKELLVYSGYLKNKSAPKNSGSLLTIAGTAMAKMFGVALITFVLYSFYADHLMPADYVDMVGVRILPIVVFILLVAYIIVSSVFDCKTTKYLNYTSKGIKLARYLEGLELYIKMAEAERLKFLQSVKGADTSAEGIVRLYEKLLPWACLFGQEKSWVKELAKYYEVENVTGDFDADLLDGIIAANMIGSVSSVVQQSISYTSASSGGGGSSFSSGGGGGGFSGGGGGGGGGGGW